MSFSSFFLGLVVLSVDVMLVVETISCDPKITNMNIKATDLGTKKARRKEGRRREGRIRVPDIISSYLSVYAFLLPEDNETPFFFHLYFLHTDKCDPNGHSTEGQSCSCNLN